MTSSFRKAPKRISKKVLGAIQRMRLTLGMQIKVSKQVFVLSILAAFLSPGTALAGDDYPPVCRDATMAVKAGKGNHNQGRAWKYDIHKLEVAEREYTRCFKVAEDDEDRSYALIGLIDVANAITDFHIRMYSVGLQIDHSPHPTSTRFTSYHRNQAVSELDFDQSLLATMRQEPKYFDASDNGYIRASTTWTHQMRLLINETSLKKRLADANRMVPLSPNDLGERPRCTTPTTDLTVATLATTIYPGAQSAAGIGGSVILNGIVSAAGRLKNATITRSSDVADLDKAALVAAEETSYVPRVEDCIVVSSLATITVTFDASGKSVNLVIDDAR